MKKMGTALVAAGVLFSAVFSSTALAGKPGSEIEVLGEYKTPTFDNAKVDYVDPNLVGTRKISTEGAIGYEYAYSTYSYYYSSITGYDTKPITNNIFLRSVAPGLTVKYTTTQSNTGSVSIGTSIEASAAQVIKYNFTGNYTGSWTSGTGVEYTLSAPSGCGCNSYNFYTATGFDTYSSTLKKYNVYNVYNGTIKTGTETEYAGTVTVNSVYVPKQVMYGKAATY